MIFELNMELKNVQFEKSTRWTCSKLFSWAAMFTGFSLFTYLMQVIHQTTHSEPVTRLKQWNAPLATRFSFFPPLFCVQMSFVSRPNGLRFASEWLTASSNGNRPIFERSSDINRPLKTRLQAKKVDLLTDINLVYFWFSYGSRFSFQVI